MIDKLHIYITILAAAVITLVAIIYRMTLAQLAIRLIYVIIIFFFIGLIIKNYLKNNVFTDTSDSEEEDIEEGSDDGR